MLTTILTVKNKSLIHAIWMNLKNTLSKRNQTQAQGIYCKIPFACSFKTSNTVFSKNQTSQGQRYSRLTAKEHKETF